MSISTLSNKEYKEFLQQGYTESSKEEMVYEGYKGHYVTLKKSIDTCERVARCTGCIFMSPFMAVLNTLTCCGCYAYCFKPCAEHLYGPAMDGAYIEQGFLKDDELTKNLRREDFKALGYNSFDFHTFVNENRNKAVKSTHFPQHSYIPFYGPKSNISYVIIIPFNNDEKALFYPVSNEKGEPCNTAEMQNWGEKLCGAYKEGLRNSKIQFSTKKVLDSQTSINSNYGTYQTNTYKRVEVVEYK